MMSKNIPNILLPKGALFDKHFSKLIHPLKKTVECLLYVSDYAARNVGHLEQLLQSDDCLKPLTLHDYQQLVMTIEFDVSPKVFAESLRYFRHRYLLRLLLRELAHLMRTEETMKEWSHCADVLILHTLSYCDQQLSKRFGEPLDKQGEPVKLYTIAMGKLGGRELNFSSDIDLIFVFSAEGSTNGTNSINNQQYFTKLVQQFNQLLQNITEDGFVFRVDLRLRPNGESGTLVCTLRAMETYYQEQGREWERYAMVKARPISFNTHEDAWFYDLILPFVYRRYVDFSVIESLRSMKSMIEREVQLNSMLDDIKRGRGGIREVEFIIQCFQLIRGGRLPNIQQQNALLALYLLKKEGLLRRTRALQQAYLFLRKLENALQMQNDQQTHSLPIDEMKRAQLVLFMEMNSWEQLLDKLHQYQRIISGSFQTVLAKADLYQDEKRLLANQLASLWQGHIEPSMAINLLTSLHFKEPERCYQMLHAFRHSPRCRRLSQTARIRLDRFMLLFLTELTQVIETDTVLLQVLRLLENIVGRSAYLALLIENPLALQELLHWVLKSPFITTLLVEHPFLLEVLLSQKNTWQPETPHELKESLKKRLAHCVGRESQDDMLRQFKLLCWLRALRAELYGYCDAIQIAGFLADVAQVLIAEVLHRACLQLKERYPQIMRVKSSFAIIAYGKLGSREMNYDSDVDLVFLHKVPPEDESLVTRLTQKMLHMLTTRMPSGILYLVDTRLRPSGSAGLLVSHLDAFMEYQRDHAWTWEHQAILRARVLFGSKAIHSDFIQLKR